uniref:Uncharacterized protein LOC105058313 n=1 Tax=Elaeis guineensis var. tenera TaxID=51953 RepID=A0A6I9SH20_ELAGV|nr:uncharacterized protein LOC105058313 [Elaeis guineensis]
MGDHLVLYVDRLIAPQTIGTIQEKEGSSSSGEPVHASFVPLPLPVGSTKGKEEEKEEHMDEDDEEPLIQMAECRICQEEDHIKNLETPCACSGSLKYVHRACVQHWCNEKGDITCEICHEPYKPGYTAPPRATPDETTIDISGGWTITGAPLDLHDHRILAMAAAQHHFLEAEYDEYASTNARGAAFCHSVALILMALLLLRHALTITNGDEDDDASTFFFTFSTAGCWISITMLHHGLGHKYLAASKAKTGSSCHSSDRSGAHTAGRASKRPAVRHST